MVHLKFRRLSLIAMIVFSTIGCDQATKIVARDTLKILGSISYLNNTIRLQYAENTGAFLSVGAALPANVRFMLFVLLAGFFLAILAQKLFARNLSWVSSFGLALMFGGGTGNLIDRLAHGRVIDFLNIGVGDIRTGIFNIADVAVFVGLILIVLEPWILRPAYAKVRSKRTPSN